MRVSIRHLSYLQDNPKYDDNVLPTGMTNNAMQQHFDVITKNISHRFRHT